MSDHGGQDRIWRSGLAERGWISTASTQFCGVHVSLANCDHPPAFQPQSPRSASPRSRPRRSGSPPPIPACAGRYRPPLPHGPRDHARHHQLAGRAGSARPRPVDPQRPHGRAAHHRRPGRATLAAAKGGGRAARAMGEERADARRGGSASSSSCCIKLNRPREAELTDADSRVARAARLIRGTTS